MFLGTAEGQNLDQGLLSAGIRLNLTYRLQEEVITFFESHRCGLKDSSVYQKQYR